MIKITTLMEKTGLPTELILEILSYLSYIEFKGIFIMSKINYIYWASPQTKKILNALFVSGIRHSVYDDPSGKSNQGRVWHKFGLVHRFRKYAIMSKNEKICFEYGIKLRHEDIETKTDTVFKYGLRHGGDYIYGVNTKTYKVRFKKLVNKWWGKPRADLSSAFTKTICVAFDKLQIWPISKHIILSRVARVAEIVNEILDKIKKLDFDNVLRDSAGFIGNKENPTYVTQQGDVIYMNQGVISRVDEPAVILVDGTELYFNNGKLTFVGWHVVRGAAT